MATKTDSAFAIWITGLPASGKSALTLSLTAQLRSRHVHVAVLESDTLRKILTVLPQYTDDERDLFYQQMAGIGTLLTEQGISVIFDATATNRSWRQRAKQQIGRLLQVYVDCPLEVCMARDPKGIYRLAREGTASHVPGLQTAYEPPADPDVVVHSDVELPERAAQRVIAKLEEMGYLSRDLAPAVP